MFDFEEILATHDDGLIFTCGLLLPEDQEKHAITLYQELAKNNPLKMKFVLGEKHPPYVRLYETVLPSAEIDAATERVRRLASKMPSFNMQWAEIEQTENFVAIWGEVSKSITLFQKTVLLEINPLREGYFKEKYIFSEEKNHFTAAEEESFRKWGSPWAEPYFPHMIIAKAKSTFNVSKFTPEWEYADCDFRGLLAAVSSGEQDFVHLSKFDFMG